SLLASGYSPFFGPIWRRGQQRALLASSGPTPAEQIAALFDGHDGVYLRGGDASAYFLTNLGQVNVSADNDTVGLALDAHLMGGVAAGAFIDAQPELVTNGTFDSDVSGWVAGKPTPTISWNAG